MNLEQFSKNHVIPDVAAKASEYAEKLVKTIELKYNSAYDNAIKIRDTTGFAKEAYEKSGLGELKKAWTGGRYTVGMESVEPVLKEICERELCEYYQDRFKRDAIHSYSSTGYVYRRIQDGSGVREWANKQGKERAVELIRRVVEKIRGNYPHFRQGNEDVVVLPGKTGSQSSDWTIEVTFENTKITVSTKLVYAGGNNIQKFHTRFLVNIKK